MGVEEVSLTEAEREAIAALAQHLGSSAPRIEEAIRLIARAEVAVALAPIKEQLKALQIPEF